MKLRVFTLLIVLGVLLPSVEVALADRGMIPVQSNVSVYEPGQKAIVAWNGTTEILILSTDVFANSVTKVLEILPLPSNPSKVELASFDSFTVIQELIWSHVPSILRSGFYGDGKDVNIVFHEKIGMHDITIVEATDVSGLVEWIGNFLAANGISQNLSIEGFESVLSDYLLRAFRFFVLDLIELSPERKSAEPILYEFTTESLYYPLLITTPVGGDGLVQLFVVTDGILQDRYEPFEKGMYRSLFHWEPIQFRLTRDEIVRIDSRIAVLFKDKACITALVYDGPLGTLVEDLAIRQLLPLFMGDLDANGIVNIVDVAIVARAFAAYAGQARWNSLADVNYDMLIDILDLTTVAKDFGRPA